MEAEQKQEKRKGSVWKPIAIIFIIFTIILLAGFAGVLLFLPQGILAGGKPVTPPDDGNPLVVVGSGDAKIFLTSQEDYTDDNDLQTVLTIRGMDGQCPTTLGSIKSDITRGLGDKSDRTGKSYLAFSFYIVNRSERVVSYEMTVNVLEATGNVLGAVRVMLIEGDAPLSAGTVYAHPEKTQEATDRLAEKTGYTTTSFESDSVICKKQSSGLETRVKQTIIVWLEGWDDDCNNDILNCSLKLNMEITAF